LEAIVRDRNAPQKHVWRAEIVLLTAEELGTVEIMRRTGKSRLACGDGKNASCRRVARGSCATRHDLRG
jgi:hypothetical protein